MPTLAALAAATGTEPLPEARGAVVASAGAGGSTFNEPFGRRYGKYLEG
jgi:hypothetical protein